MASMVAVLIGAVDEKNKILNRKIKTVQVHFELKPAYYSKVLDIICRRLTILSCISFIEYLASKTIVNRNAKPLAEICLVCKLASQPCITYFDLCSCRQQKHSSLLGSPCTSCTIRICLELFLIHLSLLREKALSRCGLVSFLNKHKCFSHGFVQLGVYLHTLALLRILLGCTENCPREARSYIKTNFNIPCWLDIMTTLNLKQNIQLKGCINKQTFQTWDYCRPTSSLFTSRQYKSPPQVIPFSSM